MLVHIGPLCFCTFNVDQRPKYKGLNWTKWNVEDRSLCKWCHVTERNRSTTCKGSTWSSFPTEFVVIKFKNPSTWQSSAEQTIVYWMASSNLNPAFAYTVVYVKDVAKSVAFYAKAFGYSVRRLDQSHRYI